VVSDQLGSPNWTRDIVDQSVKILGSGETGIFHVSSKGEISRYDFAKLILKHLAPDAKVEPCATKDYPKLAKRPARSTLKSERLEKLGIDVMRPYDVALEEFLSVNKAELLSEVPD
jgi:dTDP-4-dehydrorhamnose reductase